MVDENNNVCRVGFTSRDLEERLLDYKNATYGIEMSAYKAMNKIYYVEWNTEKEAYDFEGFLIDTIRPRFNIQTHKYDFNNNMLHVKWIEYDNLWEDTNVEPKEKAIKILNKYFTSINQKKTALFIRNKFISLKKKKGTAELYDGYWKSSEYWDCVCIYFFELLNEKILEKYIYLKPSLWTTDLCYINEKGDVHFSIRCGWNLPDFIYTGDTTRDLYNDKKFCQMLEQVKRLEEKNGNKNSGN